MDYAEAGDLLSNMDAHKSAIPKAAVIFLAAEVLEGKLCIKRDQRLHMAWFTYERNSNIFLRNLKSL